MINEALGELLGVNTENVPMIETAVLRPKKRNYSEQIDKNPRSVQKVIVEILNKIHKDGTSDKVLFRYNVVKTNLNIIITANHIIDEGHENYTIFAF
jgi:hypothetical protein